VLAVTYSLVGLRNSDFVPSWQTSYRLAFGDFEEDEVHDSDNERIVFFFATFCMPLVMLNLIVAIMGDVYNKINAVQDVADIRERLLWILELSRFFKWKI
jgi:hypothetical protein